MERTVFSEINYVPLPWQHPSGKLCEDSPYWHYLFWRTDLAPVSKEIMTQNMLFWGGNHHL